MVIRKVSPYLGQDSAIMRPGGRRGLSHLSTGGRPLWISRKYHTRRCCDCVCRLSHGRCVAEHRGSRTKPRRPDDRRLPQSRSGKRHIGRGLHRDVADPCIAPPARQIPTSRIPPPLRGARTRDLDRKATARNPKRSKAAARTSPARSPHRRRVLRIQSQSSLSLFSKNLDPGMSLGGGILPPARDRDARAGARTARRAVNPH